MPALLALALLGFVAALGLGINAALLVLAFGVTQLLVVSVTLRQPTMSRTRYATHAYCLVLTAISLATYHQSVGLGSPHEPYLMGSDGEGYFAQAMQLSGGGRILERLEEFRANYLGYQVVLALSFDLFGKDLFTALLINNTALVFSVILLAKTTFLITRRPGPAFYSAIAFMLTAKFAFYANVLLKEPFLILGVTLLSYAFAHLRHGRGTPLIAYAGLAIAILIFGTMRQPMLVLIPLGLLLLGRQLIRKGWLIMAGGIAAAGVMASVFANFTTHEFTGEYVAGVTLDNQILDRSLRGDEVDADGVVGQIMGGYTALPLPARVVTVPVPALIQFVLPFDFWSTSFLDDHIASFLNSNLNIVWYMFVGALAFFTVFYWRHLPEPSLQLMFALGVGMFLMIAFIFGGAVPRYADPYLVLMFPAVGFWMDAWRSRGAHAARLTGFFKLYYFGFCTAGAAYLLFLLSR